MREALERSWYDPNGAWPLLKPLAWVFGGVVALRRGGYRRGWLASERIDVPVLVVGNITVGGSGKTPLTLALIDKLRARGLRVGVVSRGYGGKSDRYPLDVDADTPAALAGDEPAMIARQSGALVVVDPRRPRGARRLVAQGADIVIADDGLQHYALARDAEIAVTDARRGLGNARLLPAGPLREAPARLDTVDLSLVHGQGADFWLAPGAAYPVAGAGATRELTTFKGAPVHAIAGIGDPRRFFDMLREQGLEVIEHPMPDHHRYEPADLDFADDYPVLMTCKDAVKCGAFDNAGRCWQVPVRVSFSQACEARIEALLDRLTERVHMHRG
ncbi:tetraacyldisaccharide 4'-kinase [Salinisphaera sp. T5B8]|uniref:tetraacyldisaccharide 4'-kinase n=1 Tax=Salinisphaera sp. T5B8 TaxID=1304154 RepID=UPI003340DE78